MEILCVHKYLSNTESSPIKGIINISLPKKIEDGDVIKFPDLDDLKIYENDRVGLSINGVNRKVRLKTLCFLMCIGTPITIFKMFASRSYTVRIPKIYDEPDPALNTMSSPAEIHDASFEFHGNIYKCFMVNGELAYVNETLSGYDPAYDD